MFDIRAGETVVQQLPPVVNLNGAPVNADANPTAVVVVNGVDSLTVLATVGKIAGTTGLYTASFTAPTEPPLWTAGSIIQLRVALAVSGRPINATLPVGQVAKPLPANAITDAAFGWDGTDAPGIPSTVLGRLRRWIGEWFLPRIRNRTTDVETSYAANGTTALHKRTVVTTTVDGVTTDRVEVTAP